MLEAYKYYPVESKRLLYLNISIDFKKIIYYYCYETRMAIIGECTLYYYRKMYIRVQHHTKLIA